MATERTMTPGEIESHLQEIHITTLATAKRDGSPQISPVWYEYRDKRVLIIARKSTAKVQNIRRDPRVGLSVSTPYEPFRYVLIYGNAEVTDKDVESITTSICVRYRGQERGTAFARELLDEGGVLVIGVVPTKTITWVYER